MSRPAVSYSGRIDPLGGAFDQFAPHPLVSAARTARAIVPMSGGVMSRSVTVIGRTTEKFSHCNDVGEAPPSHSHRHVGREVANSWILSVRLRVSNRAHWPGRTDTYCGLLCVCRCPRVQAPSGVRTRNVLDAVVCAYLDQIRDVRVDARRSAPQRPFATTDRVRDHEVRFLSGSLKPTSSGERKTDERSITPMWWAPGVSGAPCVLRGLKSRAAVHGEWG